MKQWNLKPVFDDKLIYRANRPMVEHNGKWPYDNPATYDENIRALDIKTEKYFGSISCLP